MRDWSKLKLGIVVALVTLGGTVLVGIASVAGVVLTGTEEFCSTACHSMAIPAAEFKDTIHDTNRTGVRATCSDCHIPHHSVVAMLVTKTKAGIKDIYGEMTGVIDTKEKYEKERYGMAVQVWTVMKQSDSRECRHCHTAAKMNPEKQSETARKKHEALKAGGMTCIDCHFGIAHTEPDGPGPQELKIAK
jgi:cytochrome c-type protein NapC